MNKLTIVLAISISILFTTSAIAQVPTDQARNFQIDAAHTGSVTTPGLTPPLKEKWVANFGRPISYPVIADGRVFVTVKDPTPNGTTLFALDATNGATLWSIPLGGTFPWSAVCYENGRVFAMNGGGLLRAFDGASGNLLWSTQIGGGTNGPPTVFQGVVYISGGGNARLFAVNANTGAVIWNVPVVGGDTSSPAVTSDGLWVSYACPNVYKLNPATGAQIWWYWPHCNGGGGKTPALYNGRLYVRDTSDFIFDAELGTIIGTFNAKSSPAFVGNTYFFLDGSHGLGSFGILRARDVNTNTELWSFAGDGQLQSGVLAINDYVYIGSASGKLYALKAATGQQVWVTTAGASIPYVDEHSFSQPTTSFAAVDGMLIVPTSTTLVAYEVDLTPPSLTFGDPTPAANGTGWNTTPVDVPFTTVGVQIADPASPLHFTSQGANQTQQVNLTDRNGSLPSVTSPVINIDWTIPSTSAVVTPGCSDWCSSDVQVTLNASDNVSGVANTFYRVDFGATQTYTAPFTVSNDGTHSVSYWSVDVAGNMENAHWSFFKIDKSAPVTFLSWTGTQGSNGWYKSVVQVSMNAIDSDQSGVANTYYRVDGGATQTYSGSFSISNEGVHQVNYWSVDALGNTEATRTIAIKLDWTAGSVQSSLSGTLGNLNFYTTPVQVTLTGSDSLSGVANVYYRLDSGNTNLYFGAFTVSTDGNHTVDYWTTDLAGNTSSTSTVTFKIDRTPPVSQVSFSTNNLGNHDWYRGSVQISMSATDSQSGVQVTQYTFDGGSLKTYTTPFNNSSNGIHTIAYWSTDKVLNTETVRTVQLKIDQQAPSITMSATPSSVVASSTPVTVTVSGRVTDAISGVDPATVFYNVIDEYSVISLSGPVTLQPNGDFSFTLSLPATKNAGDRQHVYTIYLNAGDMAGVGKSQTDTVKIN